MTTESSKNGRCNNIGSHALNPTIFNRMFTTACWVVQWLGKGQDELGFDLLSGWLVVTHTYLYRNPLSLSLSLS